jgi:hypothetical protein
MGSILIFKKKPESKSKSILKQLVDDHSPKSYSLFFTTSNSGLVTKKLWNNRAVCGSEAACDFASRSCCVP